jgi:hypothetical protein
MKTPDQLGFISLLMENEKWEEARSMLNEVKGESLEFFLLKGKIEQKFQNWGPALNAYRHVLEVDPGNSEAKNNIHLIQNILNFWNPEMFNP